MSGDGLHEHGAATRPDGESPKLPRTTPQPLVFHLVARRYLQDPATGPRPDNAVPSEKEDVPISAMRCGLY